MINPGMLTFISNELDKENASILSKYLIYKVYGKQSPKRLTLSNLIIDVNDLHLCSTLFGDTFYWFDLKSLLEDCNIDIEHFKALLEMHNLGLISLQELEQTAFCSNSSLCKKFLFNVKKGSSSPLSVLNKVVQKQFNSRYHRVYYAGFTEEELLVYRVSLLSDLKGLTYFFSHLLVSYSRPLLEYLLHELSLDVINPKLYKDVVSLDKRFPIIYKDVIKRDTDFRITEYFTITENLLEVLGGVSP